MFFKQPGLNVFCSLGSSGYPETLKLIVEVLRSIKGINVVCATTTILKPEELGEPSDNFYACQYVPAPQVCEMADLAVHHGGQGTIQTAVWAGTPVIGIGFQGEQQANIDGVARQGMAIRIPIFQLNRKRLVKAINEIQQPKYSENAQRMQQLLRSTYGVKKTVDTMNEFIIGSQ